MQFDHNFLLEIYTKENRPLLEFAAPVWSSSLSVNDSKLLETVQKDVFKLILPKYTNYENACIELKCQSLEERRLKLCKKFAFKEIKREQSFFTEIKPNYNLRNSKYKNV